MSMIRLADIDGRIGELAESAISWQTRCDACEKPIVNGETVQVLVEIFAQGARTPNLGIDLHLDCVPRLDWPGIISTRAAELMK